MDWSNAELRATVRAYLDMLAAQQGNQEYSKAEYRRKLRRGPLNARTEPSIEYRMRNISAVMGRHGLPILQGYLPAKNVGDAVAARLWSMISEEREGVRSVGVSRPPARAGSPPPMVFFNIGWMKRYSGTSADDPTLGGFGFLADNEHGAEAFNFLSNADGYVQGYRPGHARRLNIARLGGQKGSDQLDGVLVVWMAREPVSKRTMVVGWYENATVFATAKPGATHALQGVMWPFAVQARASDAHLIPVVGRNFRIQSARTEEGGFGQSPTWYGSDAINERVWRYIRRVKTGGAKKPPQKGPPRNADPELRRKVEKAAVDHATAYYQSAAGGHCTVTSVEADAVGWDLEVSNGDIDLLVEVKGLQGPNLTCQLTPNEYEKMTSKRHQSRYVVYVVNNALVAPIASIFTLCTDGTWNTEDGRKLRVEERTGAVLRCD